MKRICFLLPAVMLGAVCAEAASPVHGKVFDYVPAPGQFVNVLPEWEEGDDAAAVAGKVFQYTAVDESLISLGSWGGYVTVGFDKTVVNVSGKRDIYIEGNSFQGSSTTTVGGAAEPGVVLVAYDINRNGRPDDDEWFEIAGSEYRNSVHGYEVTYFRPESDKDDIVWKDNMGNAGAVRKNPFNKNPYWPQWLSDEPELTFKGVRLPDNAKNEGTADNPYFVLSRFDYGYADNYPNLDESGNRNQGAAIDIDWAVDKDGNAVKMPGVDFVRIYTGVNQNNGWIGECSTEVGRIMNAHTRMEGRDEVVDETVEMDGKVLADFLAEYGGSSVARTDNDGVRIYLDHTGTLHFSLREQTLVLIADQTGRICYSVVSEAGGNVLDISGYPAGLYIVKAGNSSLKILKK